MEFLPLGSDAGAVGLTTPPPKKKTDNMKKKQFKKKDQSENNNNNNSNNNNTLHSDIPDPISGNPTASPTQLAKYDRGEKAAKFLRHAKKRKRNEDKIEKAKAAAARAELLLQEAPGYVEKRAPDENDDDDDEDDDDDDGLVTQEDIKRSVDITSAAKIFDLTLDKLGPYRHRFTRNGRHLVLGGANGHLAAFDWQVSSVRGRDLTAEWRSWQVITICVGAASYLVVSLCGGGDFVLSFLSRQIFFAARSRFFLLNSLN